MSDDNYFDDLAVPGGVPREPRRPVHMPRTAAQVRAAMARTSATQLDALGDAAEQSYRRHMKWRYVHLNRRDHNLLTSRRRPWFDRQLDRVGAWLFGDACSSAAPSAVAQFSQAKEKLRLASQG